MGICVNCNKSQEIDRKISSFTKALQPVEEFQRQGMAKHPKPIVDERFDYQNNKEAPTAIISKKAKEDKDIALILSVLKNHYIFKNIDKSSQMKIIKKVKCFEVAAKEVIFEQGQPGRCFFVVSAGRLEVRANDERRILGPGQSFGELALIDDRPRTATVRTLDSCVLWGLDRDTFMKTLKRLRMQEYEENKSFINSANIFNVLTNLQKEALLGILLSQKWVAGQVVIKEGDCGDMLYVVKEGVAVVNSGCPDSREINKGEFFGEQALVGRTLSKTTVVAATDLELVSFGRTSLIEVLGNHLEFILSRNSQRIALEKSQIFSSLSNKQRESILDISELKKYSGGSIVLPKGTLKSENLLILIKGTLFSDKTFDTLQCIGDKEMANKSEEVFESDLVAFGEVELAQVSLNNVEKAIGGDVQQVTLNNDAACILKQVQLLRGLSKERVEELTRALRIINFEDRQAIVQQNNPGHSFFIIKTGTVKVYRNEKYIRNITKNDYFGERSVLFNDFRTATVIADGPVSCWVLEREDFNTIISGIMRDNLLKRIEMQDTSVLLEELVPVKILAMGELGNVILAIHSQKGTLYALKSITLRKVEENRVQSNLLLEKNILLQIDHIMIIKLIKTFKDSKRVYFLLEYVRGRDLFDILLEMGQLSEELAKFYAASLMVALEYLHERNIIHRDFKPENVLIDEEGYAKLTDFGAANIVDGRTYTAIGTPHYLAPEIILRTGYSFSVDWWSLGVMIHEMVFGYVPFGADDEDPIAIYEKILENKLDFSSLPYKSTHFRNVLTQLLHKNPAARTCGGFGFVKNNPWFGNFNWDRLMSRQLRPSYIPKCSFNNEETLNSLNHPKNLSEFLDEIEEKQTQKPSRIRRGSTGDVDFFECF
jgi:cGMP-dependent protein kinase